jgi:hypothetical protein
MESQRLMAMYEVEKWIKDLEKIEGDVRCVSRIHSNCVSVRFANGNRYKIRIGKISSSCCLDQELDRIIDEQENQL